MVVNDAIKESKKVLMESWPLTSFIATNPLWSLRNQSFADVVSQYGINGLMDISYYHSQYQMQQISRHDLYKAIEMLDNKQLNEAEIDHWVEQSIHQNSFSLDILFSEQCDEYQFQNPTIWIKEQIFTLLRDYFGLNHYRDSDLISFWHQRNQLKNLGLESLRSMPLEEAIAFILEKLDIPEAIAFDYLQAIYLQVYGWSSFMNWRNRHPDNPWVAGQDACEIILLMWLSYEYTMVIEKKISYKKSSAALLINNQKEYIRKCYIWQTAFELHYFDQLDLKFNKSFVKKDKRYDAQFIFCIDTRSEGLRRHIEAQGNYQTFGFAGFFGVIFKLNDAGSVSYQFPALVDATPTLDIQRKTSKLKAFFERVRKMAHFSKKQSVSPFALFEMLGFWFAFFMIYKTIQPKLTLKKKTGSLSVSNNLSQEQQFQAACNLLNSIGLVDNFSAWVVICAHQSDNINNPFKSSLDCGACGGNSGIPNAMVMCQILNNEKIRLKLKEVGIVIPDQTQFVPACHHTSYDRLEWFAEGLPTAIEQAVDCAAKNLRTEKFYSLPGINKLAHREQNWSELIPELGLINCAAIIIAPRELTCHQDLGRRTFLHSYEPSLDKSGDILTSILSAPAIVAHWISSQYYFSSVNPELFGAGNKAIHNVLPGIGVLEGNLSDLKIGLPLQSTHFQSRLMHEPRRIMVVVYAHKEILDVALQNSPDFKTLLDNQWVYLKHIEAR